MMTKVCKIADLSSNQSKSCLFSGVKSFVFVNPDFDQCNDTLAIFIHGSGVVRAGQWARKLIINNSLDQGTMLPDVLWAKEKGYDILVMNTNDNHRYAAFRFIFGKRDFLM